MIDDQRDPSKVLARARRAWSPGEADAGRVRRAIDATLAAGAATGGGRASAGTRGSASAPASTWTSRFLVAAALAAASGGAGYWAGHRAGLREAPTPALPISQLRANAATAEPNSAAAPQPAADAAPVAMPSLVPSRRGSREARQEAEPRTPSASEALTLEVRALRNAERALRNGTPGLALAFLQELDRQVPNGQLAEERDAASTLARCARGDHPFDVSLAAEFTERHPGSVYRARVEQVCATTDSLPSGDSPSRR